VSVALAPAHKVNKALSEMGSAANALAQLFRPGSLPAPDGRLPELDRQDAAARTGRSAPASSAAAEARLRVAMAMTLLSLAAAAARPAPRVGLETFAAFLQGHGILSERLDYSADEGYLQKCAYIAQEGFGLNLGYDYHLHAYGTFSSFIAADFSRLAKSKARAGGPPMPRQFRAEEFLALVSKRGIDWLCVASAVVHERGSCGPAALGPHIERMSASHNRGLVRGAIDAVGAALGPPRRAPARA